MKEPKQKRCPIDWDEKIYPCEDCGLLRSANEGGLIFTVCDECWDNHFKAKNNDSEVNKTKPRR
jgi:hypothetical protein